MNEPSIKSALKGLVCSQKHSKVVVVIEERAGVM